MSTAEKLLAAAQAEVGYREGSNNDNKYGRWYGMNNDPWCMIFVSWCAAQAGLEPELIPKLAYVPYAVDYYRSRGLYRPAGGDYLPQPGDLVFFGSSSHVGIVESCNGVNLVTIEGNTSSGSSGGSDSNGDGVYRRQRALSNSWIMAYAAIAHYDVPSAGPETIRLRCEQADGSSEIISLRGFLREGSNYIRLRDLSRICPGLEVDYDEQARLPLLRRKQCAADTAADTAAEKEEE